jgi:hypothetical protein
LEIENDPSAALATASTGNAGDVDDKAADSSSRSISDMGERVVEVHVPYSSPALSPLRHGKGKALLLVPPGICPAVVMIRIGPEDVEMNGDITGGDRCREDRRGRLERASVDACSPTGLVGRPGQERGVLQLRLPRSRRACNHSTHSQKICNGIAGSTLGRAQTMITDQIE